MNTIENLIEDAVARGMAKVLADLPKADLPDDKRVMSVKEAAKLADVSTGTVYDWIGREDCDFAYPVGRNKKILRHKFLAWLDRQARGGVSE